MNKKEKDINIILTKAEEELLEELNNCYPPPEEEFRELEKKYIEDGEEVDENRDLDVHIE